VPVLLSTVVISPISLTRPDATCPATVVADADALVALVAAAVADAAAEVAEVAAFVSDVAAALAELAAAVAEALADECRCCSCRS